VTSSIDIGILLPDVLSTYSDTGNAEILRQRLCWRDIPARVLSCPATKPPPTTCDIYLLGGGEDTAQLYAMDWLRAHAQLSRVIESQAITLAVCAGFQILGQSITDRTGSRHPGAGILDISTAPGTKRAVGEVITECLIPHIGALSGFENHLGRTTLGSSMNPLGHVRQGTGNGPAQADISGEGALTDRIFAT
jgi:CobQ-like glutamine amidotransferase family enzyme